MLFSHELKIIGTAALPIFELRGSIPLGLLVLQEGPLKVFILSIIGNLIPIPALFFMLEPVSRRLRKLSLLDNFFKWLFARARKKGKIIERYETLGLILLVAIPLPMTGAWTGCMAASLLKLPFKKSFFAISVGVLIAGGIVLSLCLSGSQLFVAKI